MLLILLLAWLPTAVSQSYPSRPIRFIVGSSAGGGGDTIARIVGRAVSGELGQQVIIDYRLGAAGNIGADLVVKETADAFIREEIPKWAKVIKAAGIKPE